MRIRRAIVYLSVSLLTFGAGLLSARLVVRKEASVSSIIRSIGFSQIPPLQFTLIERACGLGYDRLYELPDGQRMNEGSFCKQSTEQGQRAWRDLLAKSSRIVERVSDYENRFGEKGERVVALFPADNYQQESARILWYNGGKCYLYTKAPSLDLALEFESSQGYEY